MKFKARVRFLCEVEGDNQQDAFKNLGYGLGGTWVSELTNIEAHILGPIREKPTQLPPETPGQAVEQAEAATSERVTVAPSDIPF